MDKSEFFLIVIDEDRKLFTVEGPLIDDQPFKSAMRRPNTKAVRFDAAISEAHRVPMQSQSGSDTTAATIA